jgi:CelD/BcsL family acetyltransferase involved in cellulose biosynthesis
MRAHNQWSTVGLDLPPVAPATGPFADRAFLETLWLHRATSSDELLLVESDSGLIPLARSGERLVFAGEEDLVDYHSPLGSGTAELLAEFAAGQPSGTPFRFDSLPVEAAEPIAKGLSLVGIDAEPSVHEVAAVLTLPDTFEDWLASIGKKERHEVRRKNRRFETELGAPSITRVEGESQVRAFAEMHRRAAGEKGSFMSPAMENLFVALHEKAGAFVDVLAGDDGVPVAAGFGFEDDEAYYLYNSAYEPAARHVSPGIVLLAGLVGRAIAEGRKRFDFMKGDESYKFRHGAEPRNLYVLEGTLP